MENQPETQPFNAKLSMQHLINKNRALEDELRFARKDLEEHKKRSRDEFELLLQEKQYETRRSETLLVELEMLRRENARLQSTHTRCVEKSARSPDENPSKRAKIGLDDDLLNYPFALPAAVEYQEQRLSDTERTKYQDKLVRLRKTVKNLEGQVAKLSAELQSREVVDNASMREEIKKQLISEIRKLVSDQMLREIDDPFAIEEMQNNLDCFVHKIQHCV